MRITLGGPTVTCERDFRRRSRRPSKGGSMRHLGAHLGRTTVAAVVGSFMGGRTRKANAALVVVLSVVGTGSRRLRHLLARVQRPRPPSGRTTAGYRGATSTFKLPLTPR